MSGPGLSDAALGRLRDAAEVPEPDPARYVIQERIGRGGMGTVYRARDVALERDVALKVLHVGEDGGELAARLTREARTLAQLEHPGIVPVHDVGVLADGRSYYTMKLVHGQPLDALARGRARADLLRLFVRICEPVAFAHARGAVHRDVKPQNVMLGEFGEVLVLDWGVAKWGRAAEPPGHALQTAPEQTGAGRVLGTHGYMAPEQARGDSEHVDARADVYSLGKLLEFLVAISDVPRAPRALGAIIGRATHLDAAGRYAHAGELAKDVLRYLAAERVDAYRENLLEQTLRLYRKHRPLVLLIAAYLLMRVALILWRAQDN